jgi:hypothetical protein
MLFNRPHMPSLALNEYIRKLGPNIRGCEIGVCHGENLCHMLEACDNIENIIAIDPYIAYQCANGYVTQEMVDVMLDIVYRNLDEIGLRDKVDFRKLTSDEAVVGIDDNYLDFIFIDGNHTYEYALRDMQNYFSKVKSGGIFAGHDYSLSQVNTALMEFLSSHDIPLSEIILLSNDSWFFYKK